MSWSETRRIVSRRGFLSTIGTVAALGAGVVLLQACQQAAPSPTPAPKPTEAPKPAATTAPTTAPTAPTAAPKPTEALKPAAAATPTVAPKPAASGGKKDANIWHTWQVKQAEPLVNLTNEFNTKQSDVNAILTFVPSDQMTQKIMAAIAAGNPPETMPGSPFNLPAFADAGGVKDLTEYTKTGELDIKDVYPGCVNIITYKGKVIAVPLTVGTQGYYMNEELWKAAGLDPVEKPPKTWDDLIKYAQALNKPAEKQWGWMLHNDGTNGTSQIWASYLMQNGGEVLNAEMTKATFNGPEGVEALQFWVDLVNKYKVSPQAKVAGSDITQAYGTGKVGFFQEYPFYLGQIRELKFRSQTAPLTTKAKPGCLIGGWYFPVFAKSKQPEAGLTFLTWMFKPENQHRLNIGMGNLPTKTSTVNFPAYQDHLKKEPQINAFVNQLAIAKAWPAHRAMPEITDSLGQAIQEALYMRSTPKQALDNVAQKTDALLKKAQ